MAKGSRVDHSSGSLQPKHCDAQLALDELEREMNRQGKSSLVVVAGSDVGAVAERLDRLESQLAQAKVAGEINTYTLPAGLWPHPSRAQTNLAALAALQTQLPVLQSALDQAGFTPDAAAFTADILSWWQAHAASKGAIWPTNTSGQWMLRRAVARSGDRWLAAGMVSANDGAALPEPLQQLHRENDQIWLTGWPQLADALLAHVESRLGWLVAAMIALVTACLWLAFRRWSEVLLSFVTLGFSLLLLLGVMAAANWSWNLMSLMAVPLLLGAGVDYTIHIQLALRRHLGDVRAVRRITGRAVLLCAATTAVGFGSNAFSSNAGLAALGGVCAVGITLTYLTAAHLLPVWWLFWHGDEWQAGGPPAAQPSVIYHARLWNLGLAAARFVPECLAVGLGRTATRLYCSMHPRRRAAVENNLLPLCDDDPQRARQSCRRLYANFGEKIVQLLRREAGLFNAEQLAHWSGWELLKAAQAKRRGVLLVTPHLGDWELGGTMLAKRGVRLLVLTQPEPGVGFTELRQRSRVLSGIETIVVGQDAFAFVEVIKHLQAGAVVALLADRPPAPTAVTVELFGRPFRASIAAAELARASGCVVLPVYVVHGDNGAEAHVLPEIEYDRQQLGQRDARREMTQRIMRAFEPVIKKHADQWYNFMPLWLKNES
jgi:lauroyl/myristoyl acyltransferase